MPLLCTRILYLHRPPPATTLPASMTAGRRWRRGCPRTRMPTHIIYIVYDIVYVYVHVYVHAYMHWKARIFSTLA